MSATDEIMANIPLRELAAQLGVDEATAEAATRQAIPALLGGMQANAADPAGAASLMSAVEQHGPSVLGSGLDQIDTQDGQRIVQNVFGEQTPDVMNRLGAATPGQGSSLIQKLLPIIAPIVMAYLAKKLQGGASSTSAAATDDPMGGLGGMLGGAGAGGGGGLGDVLGSVLGGGAAGGAGGSQGGGIGDILGQVLGGAGGSQTQPGTPTGQGGMGDLLGGVLGGLLGGGKR
jgi:hypothetical protein